jgi:hypothetical protein
VVKSSVRTSIRAVRITAVQRIPDKQAIIDQVDGWVRERNKTHAVAQWHTNATNAPLPWAE